MPKDKTVTDITRVLVNLHGDQAAWLRKQSAATHRSISELVREAIDIYQEMEQPAAH